MIDIQRFLDKLDSYLFANNMDGAMKHIDYWLKEASATNDYRAQITILNEMIGICRKTSDKEKCTKAINEAFSLIILMHLEGEIIEATTYLNAATAYKAFGDANEALKNYRHAESIYKRKLSMNDSRFAGLYNNMALALAECGFPLEAASYYEKALQILQHNPKTEPEQAITYLNMADLLDANTKKTDEDLSRIDFYLKKAHSLLESYMILNEGKVMQDGSYAYVCDKCAPVFDYYGYFAYAEELTKRSQTIYANNK